MQNTLPEIDEEKGEVICDVCKGKGCMPSEIDSIEVLQSVCWKCQGDGVLDWVSFLTGKPKKKQFYGTSGTGYSMGTSGVALGPTSNATGMSRLMAIGAAKRLADDVDKAILKKITAQADKNILEGVMGPWNIM